MERSKLYDVEIDGQSLREKDCMKRLLWTGDMFISDQLNDLSHARCFISGPMRGIPKENEPMFHAMKVLIQKAGQGRFRCVTPYTIGPLDKPLDQLMVRDYEYIRQCHRLLVLPWWHESKGTLAEMAFAHAIGMPVHPISVDAAHDSDDGDIDRDVYIRDAFTDLHLQIGYAFVELNNKLVGG